MGGLAKEDAVKQPNLFDDTDGYVGRPASAERAIRERDDGTRNKRHKKIMKYLMLVGQKGATWRELSAVMNLHHGQISGALSNLHRQNEIFALRIQRDRCHPYVHSCYKTLFPDDQRFDESVRTASSLRNELIEQLLAVLRDSVVYNVEISLKRMRVLVDQIDSLQ